MPRDPSPGRAETDDSRRYFVVCGDDPLAHRLVEELAGRYNAEVAVIVRSRAANHGPQISQIPGVRVIEGHTLDAEAFAAVRIETVDALALVHQNDVGNLDAALIAQELNPGIRLVLRMFNTSLGFRVRRMIPCTVLSDASMAAPAFVSAALGELELNSVRVPGRTLFVAHRHEVLPQQVVCGLAVSAPGPQPVGTAGQEPEVLPAEQERADLVLAVADGATAALASRLGWSTGTMDNGATEQAHSTPRRRGYRIRVPALREAVRTLIDRKLVLAAAALVLVLLLGTAALVPLTDRSIWGAAYVVLLTAVGGASADSGDTQLLMIVQAIVTLAGVAIVPVVTAAVVEAVLNARLALALGRLRQPVDDHIVVVGLGTVGTRVIRGLHEFGVPVVAIDRVATARGAELARRLGIPLIVGDASQEATLQAASVRTCRALVVLSTDDNSNLEAALHGRALKPDLRVVLRLFDGAFAKRVQRAFGIAISHSVSYVAAPAFAAAMMDRDLFGTIPVGRRVLLITDVPVEAGSWMDGATVADGNIPGASRIIALHQHLEPRPQWTPPLARSVAARDRLIVVATRAGLADMLQRVTRPVDPEPAIGA